ncbi:MAG TPA: L-threonylcarbamoyladenylate synthase [Pyrinomonadaceae bacterium]|nr:L-threonylcarbamoyladenylate synthase [Pyrinomonadaceae bacterium]
MENSEQLIIADGPQARRRAAESVAAGGVVAFRTDTFYGLGVDPFNAGALRALNELKGREGKPILLLVAEEAGAGRFLRDDSRLFRELSARFWPGALTIVAGARAEVPELLTAGTGTVGVRLPGDEAAREIVRACGGALTATSANPAGSDPARTALEAARYFREGLSLVIDGGESRGESPSTVISVEGPAPRLIREGAITRTELERALSRIGVSLA